MRAYFLSNSLLSNDRKIHVDYRGHTYGSSLLHYACYNGWYAVTRTLVEKYQCNARLENEWSYTPLHYACQGRGNVDIVRFLVDQHCDPVCYGEEGRTPLDYACESGKLEIVRFLVEECHCSPRVQNRHGNTPLHHACKGNGNLDIVRFLTVDQKCDPTYRGKEGNTPLHYACASGKLDIVRFLVDPEKCHCDPKVGNGDDDTPLHGACRNGKLDIVRFLVEECHCDPRLRAYRKDTPLHYACQGNGNIDIVTFLIVDQQCHPACCGRKGTTPLHYACRSGKLDIVKFLVEECHCDPRVKNIDGHTPLHYACQENGNIDIVRFLVLTDQHCDPAAACRGSGGQLGKTPLHWACKSGKLDIVRFLMEYYCDPRVRDNHTPLHYACDNGKMDIVRFLVEECRCDPRVQNRLGDTPLHVACLRNGNVDIVRFLVVDQHCDPAGRGRTGGTPLHYACETGKLDIAKFLVEECCCDPRVRDKYNDTPLHVACRGNGHIDIVRFLIVDQHCDPACYNHVGRTPLHCACASQNLDISVRFLVEECHCDPFRMKDNHGDTPLHLAARWDQPDVVIFLLSHIPPLKLVDSVMKMNYCQPAQLLQVFMKCRTEYPLEAAFKIFVLGNHAAGKSTLVKVIENEITSLFGSFAGQWRNISKDDVELLTAGIVPVSVESRRLGQIVIYDMAGQYQYYSSHAALLRNLVSSSASMFLVVVSLNQSKEGIVRQLQYWNSFIANCCTSAGKPLTVAVFSHADEVTEEKPEVKSSDAVKALAHSESSSTFSEVVTLDCRKLASGGLTRISKIVAECCTKFRQTFQVDFAVHLLYAFISSRLAGEIACTVSELQSLVRQEQGEDSFALKLEGREFLPSNTNELSQHLTTLSDKGQFLFLRNARKVEDSWVVIDKAVLLSEVNGTIFAPDKFKQHHNIANSTGVVPFSKVRGVFPKQEPDLVVAFLLHLEFCQEISESEVSLITTRHFRCSYGPVERFFFFPALVSEERPSEAGSAIETPSFRCGWILQCSQSHQFLTPQFLHVLLVRLAFSFALASDSTHEVQTSPVLERRCCVWTNGICWLNRKGVETTVEVTEQSTVVSLTISCLTGREMECVMHRRQVIECILETREELSPVVTMKESLIHPGCLTTPTSLSSLQLYSLCELAEALVDDESVLVSQPGKTMVEVEQLLHFEPYFCFSLEMLRVLFAEENSEEIVPETFFDVVSKTAHTKVDHLKQLFSIDSIKLQRDQPGYQCKQVFLEWKENTQTPTYRALRSALDKYSVFCGRNPLVSVCVCVCECRCC